MPTEIPNRCAKQYDLINQSLGEMRAYTDQGRYVPTRTLLAFQGRLQGLSEHCPKEIWTDDTYRMILRGLNEGLDYANLMEQQVESVMEFVRTQGGDTSISGEDYITMSAFVSAIGSVMRGKARGEEWPARVKTGGIHA